MVKIEDIVKLYSAVFEKEKSRLKVRPEHIIKGVREIGIAYKPDRNWKSKENSPHTLYEDASNRCAYLLKHVMVHTGLLCDVLCHALRMHPVKEVLTASNLRLCSLGSGPGTDIVACLLVLNEHFGAKNKIDATLIDCCIEWESVFEATVCELRSYVNNRVSEENFSYNYAAEDLLHFDGQKQEISDADVITMVKFVSAVACRDAEIMAKKIFRAMKPGALLLFVDNAAGGFLEMMSHIAEQCDMESVFGPLKHHHYKEEAFCLEYHGQFKSQFETKVSVEIWKKVPKATLQWQLFHPLYCSDEDLNLTEENFPPMVTVDCGRPQYLRHSEGSAESTLMHTELHSVQPTTEDISESRNDRRCRCTIM